ncbi:MAG TPA: YciI family protein, partial [Candidatus Acidoferrum sp.]|nr:YciI family protein [Candidatus Acidoferrum sp.]
PAPLRSAMKYVLGIYETAEGFASRQGEASERYWAGWAAYSKALHDAGVIVDGAALQPPSTATVVRVNGDARTIQDGPYADTKEQLGGFIVLDVPTLEDALAWAARAPAASSGAVEVRPVLQLGVPA